MGGGAATSNPYKTLAGSVKDDDKWRTFCTFFGLEPHEEKAFFATWTKMDRKSQGAITFTDYASSWSLNSDGDDSDEERDILKRFFCLLDKDSDPGSEPVLYFQEWAVRTFGFGTLKLDGLVDWTFDMFDPDGTGTISLIEFMEMIQMCLGPSAVCDERSKAYKRTEKVRGFLDQNKDGKITRDEFKRAEAVCAELFAPLMGLQSQVHERILGASWWKEATKVREAKLNFTVLEVAKTKGSRIPWTIYDTGGRYVPWQGGRAPEGVAEVAAARARRGHAAKGASLEKSGLHKYDGDFKKISDKYQPGGVYFKKEED